MENYEILWKNTLAVLQKTVSNITYTFIEKHLTATDLMSSTLVLKAETEHFASSAVRNSDKILDAFAVAKTGITDFTIYVGNSKTPYFTSRKQPEVFSAPIDPKYTFDSFVVGESNRYLYAAAKAVADDPGNSYNPLFIYGSSGLGKTHIMQAIANSIKQKNPSANILYATCEQFTNDLINTIRLGKAYSGSDGEDFRKRYRGVDVLIIDDVQFLARKQSTQEEFFHTFNELYSRNKQIVLSADCHPKEIELLEERLKTRFLSGLMAQVLPPDIETKIAILQKKAESKKYILSLEVATFLAENSDNDVRSLEGLLTKVIFASLLKESPITIELAREAINLSKPADEQHEEALTPDHIIEVVCDFYGLNRADLISKKKKKELVEPRQICTFLMTDLLSIPLVSIGQAMGGKDHTTIIYTRDKIANLMKNNPKIATEVNDLKNLILKK